MPMTEAERKEARREASRRWYAAHKAAARKPAKKVEAKPAKKAAAQKPAKDPLAGLQKKLDSLCGRAAKAQAAASAAAQAAAGLAPDVYRAGDKFAKKALAAMKKAGLVALLDPDGKGRVEFAVKAAKFRGPKAQVDQAAVFVPFEPLEEDKKFEEPEEKPVEVPVDPAKLEAVEAGSQAPAAVDVGDVSEPEPDPEDDAEPEDEEDDRDDDELTDEELEDRRAREAENEAEEELEGRADMMREMELQGAYDD